MGKRHLKLIIILIFSLVQLTYAGSKPSTKELKNELMRTVDEKSQLLVEVSDALWEYAEIALLEYKSSKLLMGVWKKKDLMWNGKLLACRLLLWLPMVQENP